MSKFQIQMEWDDTNEYHFTKENKTTATAKTIQLEMTLNLSEKKATTLCEVDVQ